MSEKEVGRAALNDNFGVDYVLIFGFAGTGKVEAEEQLEKLVKAITNTGLEIEVRAGEDQTLLLFIKAQDEARFAEETYKYRVRDWLHGVRPAQPDRDVKAALENEPLTEAERFRIIYHLLTGPIEEGGAAISPGEGQWKMVKALFPLHDHAFNKQWIKQWSTKTFLKAEDLDQIRNMFGEKVAFYFAFTQSYFGFLIFPAVFGFSVNYLLGNYSPVYAVVSILWCVVFVEYWKRQEVDLAIRWDVKGVSAIQEHRAEYQYDKEITDPITGEKVKIFPATKRLMRQLLQIPFVILAASLLGTLIGTCFGIEIFISEVYDGPLKGALVFLPTVILTTVMPILSTILTKTATKLNSFENYETMDDYESALTSKLFVLNFITSYMGICLTAFVYMPFGKLIVPYLDIFSLTVEPFADDPKQLQAPQKGFQINPDRLRKQYIYFTVTAQIVNFAMEVVVPYIKRRGSQKVQEIKTERAAMKGGAAPASINDQPEEADFLRRVRNEAELDHYEVSGDLREMVVQFGYLALFSVVWPLAPVSFIINNWIELRSDAVKICIEMRRPTPARADTIGPWLDSLGFLTWLGSITSSALVYMFSTGDGGPRGDPHSIKAWALLLTIFASEHIYLFVRLVVRFAISKSYSPGETMERSERYMVRKRVLKAQFGDKYDAFFAPSSGQLSLVDASSPPENITRQTLEDDARAGTLGKSSPSVRFWGRQKGWGESVKVGKGLIDRLATDDSEDKKDR